MVQLSYLITIQLFDKSHLHQTDYDKENEAEYALVSCQIITAHVLTESTDNLSH